MLSLYCAKVLERELQKSDYDNMTADQGWAWLMLPVTSSHNEDTHIRLTPLMAAGVLGPVKANALAAKVKSVLPDIADNLMRDGVDLSDPLTGVFLDSLVDGSTVHVEDVVILKAIGKRTITVTSPRRFDRRFDPEHWPHVSEDGTEGMPDTDQAIHGFPNDIKREHFDLAWQKAGR